MYSGKQTLRLEKFKASDIGGLDKELKERKGSGKYDSSRTPYNIELIIQPAIPPIKHIMMDSNKNIRQISRFDAPKDIYTPISYLRCSALFSILLITPIPPTARDIDANAAASYVQELAGDDVNIIFGAMYDENKVDSCTVTVIATGLEDATLPNNKSMSGHSTFANRYMKPVTPSINKPASMATPEVSVAPVTPVTPVVTPAPRKPITGINNPGDIRSTVTNKPLNIPDFLQKK